MTSVTGLDFAGAWSRKVMVDFGGESAPVLCRDDILVAKEAAGARATARTPGTYAGNRAA